MHGENTIVDPRVKTRPEGHSWESKKRKKKTYTKVLPESSELYVNNDDIGICKIWRNDSKSPVWITEWNQRQSSTIKEIEEMSLS